MQNSYWSSIFCSFSESRNDLCRVVRDEGAGDGAEGDAPQALELRHLQLREGALREVHAADPRLVFLLSFRYLYGDGLCV